MTIGHCMRVLNPLEIKFSQQVIYPAFNDYRSIDDAIASIREKPAAGSAKYDVILHTKFPAITVTRWRPKLRDAEGNPIVDTETDEQLYGEMAWFTLDNRRLYALQRACAERHPQRCGVEVFEFMGGPPAQMAKKFRTRSNGETVMLGTFQGLSRNNVVNANKLWDPRQAVFFVECARNRNELDLFTVAKSDCALWQYQSIVNGSMETFGPFSTVQMREWWHTKQLPSSLPIRRWADVRGIFVPIDTFFKAAQPFDESVDKPDVHNTAVPQVTMAKADPDRREVESGNALTSTTTKRHQSTRESTQVDPCETLSGTAQKIHQDTLNTTKIDIYEISETWSGATKDGVGLYGASRAESYYKQNANSQDRLDRQPLTNEQSCSRAKTDSKEWQGNDNSNSWIRSWHQATGSSTNAWHADEWKKREATAEAAKASLLDREDNTTSLPVSDATRWSNNRCENQDASSGTDKASSLQGDYASQWSSNRWKNQDASGGTDNAPCLRVDDALQWSSNKWNKQDANGGTDKPSSLQVDEASQWSSNRLKNQDANCDEDKASSLQVDNSTQWSSKSWKNNEASSDEDKTVKTSLQVAGVSRWSSTSWNKQDVHGGTNASPSQVSESTQWSNNGWNKRDAKGGRDKLSSLQVPENTQWSRSGWNKRDANSGAGKSLSLQVPDGTRWPTNEWNKRDANGGWDKSLSLQLSESTQWSTNGWSKHDAKDADNNQWSSTSCKQDDQWGASWSKKSGVSSGKCSAPEHSWTSNWKTDWNSAWADA